MPKTTIKGQAIADFVVEFTYLTKVLRMATDAPSTLEGCKKDDKPTDPSNVWSLRIDGSSNMNRSGAGVILESPIGEKISYALRIEFPALTNEAGYKALLAGLQIAKEMGVGQLRIYSNSQLVVNQINGDYKDKGKTWQPTSR